MPAKSQHRLKGAHMVTIDQLEFIRQLLKIRQLATLYSVTYFSCTFCSLALFVHVCLQIVFILALEPCGQKINFFRIFTSTETKPMSKFVKSRPHLTFSWKILKKVCKLACFADFFPHFHDFLHFSQFSRLWNSILCKICWQNFKNKQILSATEDRYANSII